MTATFTPPAIDADQLTAFLDLVMPGDTVHEIALFDALDGRSLPLNMFARDPAQVQNALRAVHAGAYRVAYIRPNQLNREPTPGFAPIRSASKRYPHSAAVTSDVARLRWIQLDVDAAKDDGDRVATTDAQHADAIRKRDRVQSRLLTQWGIEAAYAGDTGNGGNLLVPIDLPNTAEHRRVLKAIVATINAEMAGEGIAIDPAVVDAPRFVGLAGTVNAKEPAPDATYPWRLRTGTIYPDVPPAPEELVRDLAAPSLRTRSSGPQGAREEIDLTAGERQMIVRAIAPHWRDGTRHTMGQAVTAMLWHRGIAYDDARSIIIALSANDTRQDDRLASLDRAWERGAAGEPLAFIDNLKEAMGEHGFADVGSVMRTIFRARRPVVTIGGTRIDRATPPHNEPASMDPGPADDSQHNSPPEPAEPPVMAGPPYSDDAYAVIDHAHHRYVPDSDKNLGYWQAITNFAAWVTGDYIYPENGELNYCEVVVQDHTGRMHGPKRVSASQFRRPDEWIGLFGSWPRVHDRVTRSQLLNAIQAASGTAPVTLVYDRTGWETTNGWRYLTASGAMGVDGLDTSVRVEPGGHLGAIALQGADDPSAVQAAVRRVLAMGEVAATPGGRMAVTALCGGAFRAPLIPARRANFTLNLVGETGSMKSGLAGLVLNLYGSAFNFDYLTGNWGSTAKANIDLLSRPRHTMLVIDDYLEGTTGGAHAARRAAERDALIRAQGNAAPVDRLKSDATRNNGNDPGVVLATTQETLGSFLNESEIGRQLVIPLKKQSAGQRGDLDADRLIDASLQDGQSGVYNLAFSAYIRHLAGQMDRIVSDMPGLHTTLCRTDLAGLRTRSGRPLHERTKPAAADLLLGWMYFLEFAEAIGAIDADERESIITRVTGEIAEIMIGQDQFQANEAPERAFLDLLQEAILTRHACLASRHNLEAPGQAGTMGWTPVEHASRDGAWTEYKPASHRIGWVDDDYVYLSAAKTSQALQAMAESSRRNVPFGERTIGQVLQRHGMALPGHGGRPTQNIRIGEHTDGGATMTRALVLPRSLVFPDLESESEAA